jgi:hypothetical protein
MPGAQTPPWATPAWTSAAAGPTPPKRRRVAFIVVGAVAGVVILVATAVVLVAAHGRHTGSAQGGATLAPSAASTAGVTVSPTAPNSAEPTLDTMVYTRGHCYTWDRTASNTSAQDVPCAAPHRFESTSTDSVSLAKDYPPSTAYPSDQQWKTVVAQKCGPLAEAYLGYPLDPDGRFSAGGIMPIPASWATGQRDLQCGIYAAIPDANAPDGYTDVTTGSAKGADQASVYPAGGCLVESPSSRLVTCATPHSSVAVGDAHMAGAVGSAAPSKDAFDQQADPLCTAVARTVLGASFQPSSTVNTAWFEISPASWAAGTRTFTCTIDYFDAAGQPRNVTGDVQHPTPAS